MDHSELQAHLAELHPMSFGWALSCCAGDHSRAEDALQAAYLKVLEGSARFGGQSEFKTWLFGVIRNSAREQRRRHLMHRAGLLRFQPDPPSPADPRKEISSKESARRIRRALAKLSARQREVLHLVFYQDLTIEEASAVMKISLGSARKHYERGKQQLRRQLKGKDDDR